MGDLIDRLEEIYNERIRFECERIRFECEWKEFNHYKMQIKLENKVIKIIQASYDYSTTFDVNVNDYIKRIDKIILEYYKRGE